MRAIGPPDISTALRLLRPKCPNANLSCPASQRDAEAGDLLHGQPLAVETVGLGGRDGVRGPRHPHSGKLELVEPFADLAENFGSIRGHISSLGCDEWRILLTTEAGKKEKYNRVVWERFLQDEGMPRAQGSKWGLMDPCQNQRPCPPGSYSRPVMMNGRPSASPLPEANWGLCSLNPYSYQEMGQTRL